MAVISLIVALILLAVLVTPYIKLAVKPRVLLIVKFLHDLGVLKSYNSPGIRYLGSCRIFRIHPKPYICLYIFIHVYNHPF